MLPNTKELVRFAWPSALAPAPGPVRGITLPLYARRIICEQVSHHPPVSAFHADSENFVFHGSIHPKLKFWGKSVEIQPKGTVTVELPK